MVSSDYKGGNECMGPMAHVLRSICTPLIRVLISNTINLVPVDHVTEIISNNIRPIDNNLNIVYATGKETLTTYQIFKHVNPTKRMFFPGKISLKFLLNTIGIELDDVFPVFFISIKILSSEIFSFRCKLLIINSLA